jgi:glycosyltransferase involved in cell wall biosynthesis
MVNIVKKYPKILIIGQTFNMKSGGGITLMNLFKGWPVDRIAVASSNIILNYYKICKKCYRLGEKEDIWIWPFSLVKREEKYSGNSIDNIQLLKEEINNNYINQLKIRSFYKNTFYTIINLLRINDIINILNPSSLFLEWVSEYKPDIIYSQLGSLREIRFITKLIKLKNIRLVIHIMDDWPQYVYYNGIYTIIIGKYTNKNLNKLFEKASKLLSISDKMSIAYKERYKKSFKAYGNSVELKSWLKLNKINWKASKPFRILYTGRIGKANERAINDICEAIEELNKEGYLIHIDIYTPDNSCEIRTNRKNSKFISFHSQINHNKIPKLLVNADLLFLPLDFDKGSIKFAKYSIPTKTSEYMISGTPVLIYAPKEMAVSEYALGKKWGYLVCENDKMVLKKELLKIINNELLRKKLGCRAREIAIKEFNADKIREQFRKEMISALNR